MAGYRTHISVSGLCGVCYGAASTLVLGFSPVQAGLAGVLTWVAGMLPDVDSESGKPVREIFSLLAAVAPFVLMKRLLQWGGDTDGAMLLAVIVYASIRYGASAILGKLSVHRGMFHSIPAMIIAAELTFLAYKSDDLSVKALMAGGVALGFLSHLVLDEVYAVEWTGLRLKLNKAAGSALKFVGKSFAPNALTYTMLMFLTYMTLVDVGLMEPPGMPESQAIHPTAAEEGPVRR